MSVIIVITVLIQFGTLIFLYVADKRLKFASMCGIKQVTIFTLSKSRYFYIYYRRKEGRIIKHAFLCMIAYYIINVTWFIVIFIQLVMDNILSFTATHAILLLSNLVLFGVAGSPLIDYEHGRLIDEYIANVRDREKKEKRKHSSR